MTTLNNFNQTVEDYPNGYNFYIVDFQDIHSGQLYFRIIPCAMNKTHKERMAHFNQDINGAEEPRYEVVRYEVDMDEEELAESGLREGVLHETYWDRTLQGAV